MKKLLISLAASLAVFAFVAQLATPVSAQAQTSFCYTFNSNLGEGRYLSSADASALTTALSSAGFWNSATPITTYTDSVASAVSGFQEKYASQILTPNGLSYGTGYVGASTRAELNTLYGCQSVPVTTTASTQCPAGYTCTPVNQAAAPFVCPSGYTCTPATTNPTQPCPSGQAWDAPLNACVGTPTNPSTSIPTVSLSASPTTIVSDEKFGTVTLSWSSTNATSCNFEKQTLSTSGSMTVSLAQTGTYSISCTGPGGTASSNPATVTFQLTGQTSSPIPTVTLSASPTSIISDGKPGTITLSWSSTNATSCGFEKQVLPASGSMTVSLSSTATYNISCIGPGGSSTSNPVIVTFQLTGQSPVSTTASNNPSITAIYPQSGSTLNNSVGSSIATIQWNEQGPYTNYPVNIQLLNQNNISVRTIAQSVPNTGSYVWPYDPTLPNGTYQLQIAINYAFPGGPTSANTALSGYFTVSN